MRYAGSDKMVMRYAGSDKNGDAVCMMRDARCRMRDVVSDLQGHRTFITFSTSYHQRCSAQSWDQRPSSDEGETGVRHIS